MSCHRLRPGVHYSIDLAHLGGQACCICPKGGYVPHGPGYAWQQAYSQPKPKGLMYCPSSTKNNLQTPLDKLFPLHFERCVF